MKHWKKILGWILWSLAAIAFVVLFILAWRAKSAKKCSAIQIELAGKTTGYLFMDEKEIIKLVNDQGAKVGTPVGDINLYAIEQALLATKWVEKTKIYIDNQQQLNIQIEQRIPIARVFTASGNSFYIDKVAQKLPLKNLSVMRLPVFTGFPSDQDRMSKPDSILLQQIQRFASIIQKDSFFLAQIAQINIAQSGDFEMIPTIGDHTVLIGKAENLEDKLNRLYTFYKKVLVPSGINAYAVLDLRFDHQLVALKKGMQPIDHNTAPPPILNLDVPINSAVLVDSSKSDMKETKPALVSKKSDTLPKKPIVKVQKVKEEKQAKKVEKTTNKKQSSKENNKPKVKTLNNTKPTPRAILPKKVATDNNKTTKKNN